MPSARTASMTISEMREFAGFAAHEQEFIERSLDIAMGRGDAFKSWSRCADDQRAIRGQYIAYRELRQMRDAIPADSGFEGIDRFIGTLARISAQDLAQEQLDGFSAYRFLYERLLGAAARPFLPAAFCAAAALPQIRPERRKQLLQSLSESAATAPGWSKREPGFYPEKVEAAA
ncbi:conserved hypothetical protein [Erythrobacter sp. EC-HK427]|nr:conserved hypothetical protein [Erythrobacter sp. EC-HK427]